MDGASGGGEKDEVRKGGALDGLLVDAAVRSLTIVGFGGSRWWWWWNVAEEKGGEAEAVMRKKVSVSSSRPWSRRGFGDEGGADAEQRAQRQPGLGMRQSRNP